MDGDAAVGPTEFDSAFWARVARLDAEADADVREGRVMPVTEEFIEQLRSIVRRPAAGG